MDEIMNRAEETSTLGDQLVELLNQIVRLYDDNVLITLITRSQNSPDGSRDTLISSDTDIEAIRESLERLWKKRESPEVQAAIKRELNS